MGSSRSRMKMAEEVPKWKQDDEMMASLPLLVLCLFSSGLFHVNDLLFKNLNVYYLLKLV